MAQRNTGGRARAAIFLLVSAGAALLAVLVIYRLIQGYQVELMEAARPEETVKVVVAKRTLYQGHTLGETDIEMRDLPPEFVPETVFHALEEVIGRVPAERIIEGEFVRRERLADPEAGVGLNAIIPRGQRAVSLNISDGSAVSNFLNPGNYVDVLVTITGTGTKATTQTLTLLQARKVLAVNNRMGGEDGDGPARDGRTYAPSVTLAVTPEEAEKLAHANREGTVTMTLRNDIDVTQVTTHGAKNDVLIGRTGDQIVEFTNVKPRKPRGGSTEHKLEMIRGTQSEIHKFKK